MIIRADRLSACASAFARRSLTSTLPSESQAVTTTFMPTMAALAGFVPWAELGIRQTFRCPCLRFS